ncbi:MAG: hypothetical protein Q9M26_09520 [Mariprofundales bacterium]|nr:hypothetical protein [Mariprofundales bacterium]
MKKYAIMAVLLLVGGCAAALPHHPEMVALSSQLMDHEKDFFVARKGLEDGYEVTLHVMPAPEGTGYSRTFYHLMVAVKKDGVLQRDLQLYSEVRHPDGSVEQSKRMMRMGDWYMARYDLSHEQGRHWLSIRFKRDGRSYTTGIYYPEIDFRSM